MLFNGSCWLTKTDYSGYPSYLDKKWDPICRHKSWTGFQGIRLANSCSGCNMLQLFMHVPSMVLGFERVMTYPLVYD